MSEPIVTFDEKAVRDEFKELVRKTVEDTLNALLDEEADDEAPTATRGPRSARRTAPATTSAASRRRRAR